MIWQACDKINQPFGPLIKLLTLTAQRRDEVTTMRWSELDLKECERVIPRGRVVGQGVRTGASLTTRFAKEKGHREGRLSLRGVQRVATAPAANRPGGIRSRHRAWR